MKILFLSRWFPYPPDNGSKVRIFSLIKCLSANHRVDLIAFTERDLLVEQISAAKEYCHTVSTIAYKNFNPRGIMSILGFFAPLPRSMVDTYNKMFERFVLEADKNTSYDLVIASEIDTLPYVDLLDGLPKLLEDLEVTTRLDQVEWSENGSKSLRKMLGMWKFSHYVNSQLKKLDGCTVVSNIEKENVLKIAPDFNNLLVLPNGVDVESYPKDSETPLKDTMIYTGALDYYANFDSMDYFLREIFPIINSKKPHIKLLITGKKYNNLIKKLPSYPNVVFTGYLNDIRSAIAKSWCSLVPLRYGGGTRIKILEAMALGTPVVSTSKGAEGLKVGHNHDILIADKPQAFADEVLRLMNSASLREKLSNHGRQTVSQYYDWNSIGQKLLSFIEQLNET